MNLAQKEREAAAALPQGSVLAVLYEQHARIRDLFDLVTNSESPQAKQAAFDRLRELLAVHEAGEEMILRPVTTKLVGPEVADERNSEESEAAHVLENLEKMDVSTPDFDHAFAAFEKSVSDHALREEIEEFPHILAEVSSADQLTMGDRLLKAEKAAPTHPHPAAAGSPTAQYLVGPFAALLDKAKDGFSGKKD